MKPIRTQKASKPTSPPRLRVLVVDDDPIVLEVIRERLQQAGYEVWVREEALGTTKWMAVHQPDVVLLDVNMPALAGDGLTQLLRRQSSTRNVRVILHSGMPFEELSALTHRCGAVGCIEKTSDSAAFMRQFREILSTTG